jgi:hypothetical protein
MGLADEQIIDKVRNEGGYVLPKGLEQEFSEGLN